jgi:crossover junction endodeoxyribonuclease RuvC
MVKKTIVGAGRAEKSQVAFMVAQLLGCHKAWPKDASDALAIAICHLNQRRFKRLYGK